jgi:Flp pilus assembly protein TadG
MEKPRHRRPLRDSRGQALVEFALVLPLLAMLLFGIVQFGIVFNHYIDLTDATRAGARKAAVSRQTTDPSGPVGVTKTAVISSAGDIKLKSTDITVTTPSGWTQGAEVSVEAMYPYSINILGIVVASGNLHSKTTERVE